MDNNPEIFSVEELRVLHQALNEVLHGPEAIEDWEFHARMGVTRDEALAVLGKAARIYHVLKGTS